MAGENVEIEKITTDNEKPACFVMMPISTPTNYESNHFNLIYTQIFVPAIQAAGYKSIRVDEDHISDSIIYKIFENIQNCPMALCDLSSRNPNVLYELGIRQAYDLPVVLVQDDKTDKIFDVGGITTTPYNSDRFFENVMKARNDISKALTENSADKNNNYSLVKIIQAKKASLTSQPISGNDMTNYQLLTIQREIRELQNTMNRKNAKSREDSIFYEYPQRHYIVNLNDPLESRAIEPQEIRVTLDRLKNFLNQMKAANKVNALEYEQYYSYYIYLKKSVEESKQSLSTSTYNHYKSLLGQIAVEFNRLKE